MKKSASMLLAGTLLLSAFGATAFAADSKDIIIACNALSQDHMYNYGLNEFKSVLEEVSGGAMTVTAHAGTIGTDEAELVEKLQIGAANIVVASPGFMTSVGIPEVDLLSLYYLFDSADDWKECVNGEFGDKFSDLIYEKSGNQFKVLAYWSSGIRNYYGAKPVTCPEDLKGVTIRCQTAQVVKDFWEGCDAIPTQVSWNELYQALQQGVVDSAENDYVSFSQKDHHKTKNGHYVCETQHTYLTPVLMCMGPWYDSLSDEERGWVDQAVKAATEVEQNCAFDFAAEAKEKVIADGAEVTNYEDMDIEAFKAIAAPIQDKFAEERGVQEYLDLIRSITNK